MKFLVFLIIVVLIATSGCIGTDALRTFFPNEKTCIIDNDCSCGVRLGSNECFYGNSRYVDTSQQCPDYCTGITGNLHIPCIDNQCVQVRG